MLFYTFINSHPRAQGALCILDDYSAKATIVPTKSDSDVCFVYNW